MNSRRGRTRSGAFASAVALALAGIGLIERDGAVAVAGAALGFVGICITIAFGVMLVLGAGALVH